MANLSLAQRAKADALGDMGEKDHRAEEFSAI